MLGYLSQSVDFCIKYQRNEDLDNWVEAHGFIGGILPRTRYFKCYVDASFASDEDTRRSTTGYVFKISGRPVSWHCQMQTSVALLRMEAEYMAASAAAQETIWLNQLLEELRFRMPKPITLYEDNKAAILVLDLITMKIIKDRSTLLHVSTLYVKQ